MAIDHVERVEELLTRLVHEGVVHGGVLGISAGEDSVVLPFGTVNIGGRARPTRPTDRFLLTSVTKPITSLQVLRLVEDGRITLRTPLSTIVPEFRAHRDEPVRVWHVLTHTSGLDPDGPNTAERLDPNSEPLDHLAAACASAAHDRPGARVAYCSPPFWILAETIRRLTGTGHVEHLQQAICQPLALQGTRYELAPDPPADLVAPHAPPELAALGEQVRRLAYPAGGIVSNVEDLLVLGRALLTTASGATHTPFSPAMLRSLRRAWTEGLPGIRDYEGVGWRTERGLGWALGGPGDLRSRCCLWHSGGSGTSMWVDDVGEVVVVLLTATWLLDYEVLHRVANAAFASLR